MNRVILPILLIIFLATGAVLIYYFQNQPNPVEEKKPEEIIKNPPPKEKPKELAEVLPEIVWGNKGKQQVIFTFDAGSGTQSLDPILSTLEKYGVKGTFFITGKWAEQNPESVKRISDSGHEIFNHTYSHPYLTQMTDEKIAEELNKANQIISQITEVSTKPYFRPPYGDRNSQVFKVASVAGYRAVYWTIDVLDWKEDQGFTSEQAKKRIMDNLNPGTIYLMHIGDDITGEILDQVFSEIRSKGYLIVSLTQGL